MHAAVSILRSLPLAISLCCLRFWRSLPLARDRCPQTPSLPGHVPDILRGGGKLRASGVQWLRERLSSLTNYGLSLSICLCFLVHVWIWCTPFLVPGEFLPDH